jgi:phosphatidylethanolamine-binding protein (PEBP) family uncharacterized protein
MFYAGESLRAPPVSPAYSVYELLTGAFGRVTGRSGEQIGPSGYSSPCPPEGESHRYVITVAALKVLDLPVDNTATPAVVGFVAHYQELARATITVQFAR